MKTLNSALESEKVMCPSTVPESDLATMDPGLAVRVAVWARVMVRRLFVLPWEMRKAPPLKVPTLSVVGDGVGRETVC